MEGTGYQEGASHLRWVLHHHTGSNSNAALWNPTQSSRESGLSG